MDLQENLSFSEPLAVVGLSPSDPIRINLPLYSGLSNSGNRTLGCGYFSTIDFNFKLSEGVGIEQIDLYDI